MSLELSLLPLRSDLRERALAHGVEELGEPELLALVLGTGVSGRSAHLVAAELLSQCGGLAALARQGPWGIAASRGLGVVKALRVAAAFELGRRACQRGIQGGRESFRSCDAVARWARPRLAALDHEQVWLLCLDAKCRLKSARRVAQGGLHGCALTPRDVFGPAVRDAASFIVLVHNHPSGDPTPSPEDVEMTRVVAEGGDLLGIPLLDHVVVASEGECSLAASGVLDAS